MKNDKIKCNLCGQNDAKVIQEPTRKNVSFMDVFSAAGGVRGTQRIVRCNNCSLVYVSPRFKENQIAKGYRESLDHGHSQEERGRRKTFEKAIILLEKIYKKKGRLLDVGCANGLFIEVAKKNGWDSFGVEISKEFKIKAQQKGLKVYQGTLQEQIFEKNYFDVITYWDVLEHVYNPKKELMLAHKLLKPSGLILVNYPDFGSIPARLSGKHWWFLLSVHLYYFTRETLLKFFNKTGFSPLFYKRHWQYLELGYLTSMFSLYSKAISIFALKMLKATGFNSLLIPYYAGQSTIIARKIN